MNTVVNRTVTIKDSKVAISRVTHTPYVRFEVSGAGPQRRWLYASAYLLSCMVRHHRLRPSVMDDMEKVARRMVEKKFKTRWKLYAGTGPFKGTWMGKILL